MKKLVYASLYLGITFLVAACGVADLSAEGAEVQDSYSYTLDGAASSGDEIQQLSDSGVLLHYFMEPGEARSTAHVFTDEKAFEAYSEQSLTPQALCISTRTRTTVYDHTSYNADSWAISKGLSYPNLHVYLQNDPDTSGDNWGDDISSIRMADCVYTTLYQNTNYGGARLRQKGKNLRTMPAGFNNTVSSLKVDS